MRITGLGHAGMFIETAGGRIQASPGTEQTARTIGASANHPFG